MSHQYCELRAVEPAKTKTQRGRASRNMGNDELAMAKISVWWDIENCNVPQNIDPNAVASNIRLALRRAKLQGSISISAFGDTKCLKATTQEALSSTGIDFNHVPRGNKEAADKAILVGMLFWALDNSPPAHFLLISGDADFANALHRLRMKRYNILLARPDHYVKRALLASATDVWFWSSLARGEVVISQPSENAEDNLPIQGGGGYSNGSNDPSIKRVISTRPLNQALTLSSSSSSSLSSVDLDQHFPSSRGGSSCFDPPKVGVSVASVSGRFSLAEDLNMGGLHLQSEMGNPKSTYSPLKHRQNQSHTEPSNAMLGATTLDWSSNSPIRNNSGHMHPRGGGPLFSESRPLPPLQPIRSLCFPPRVNNNPRVGGPLGGRGMVDDDGFGQEGGGRGCSPLPKTRITVESIRFSTMEFQAGNSSFLTMAHKAMVTLKGDMLAPTEMNLLECIQCWETPSVVENLNLRQVLEKAVECGEMKVLGVGNGAAAVAVGGFRMFLPTKSELWSCVDPKNMQLEHPKELWADLHEFLLNKEGQQSLVISRSRYHAAHILKSRGPTRFQNVSMGYLINILQQAIDKKRWLIPPHPSVWVPILVNWQALEGGGIQAS